MFSRRGGYWRWPTGWASADPAHTQRQARGTLGVRSRKSKRETLAMFQELILVRKLIGVMPLAVSHTAWFQNAARTSGGLRLCSLEINPDENGGGWSVFPFRF